MYSTPKGSVNLCSVPVKKLQTKFFFTGNKFTGFNAMETVLQVITVLVLKFKTLAMYSASQCMCIAVNKLENKINIHGFFHRLSPCEKCPVERFSDFGPCKKSCEKAPKQDSFSQVFSQVLFHRFIHRLSPCEKCPVHRF